jgi:hypothetical protein
MMEVEYVEYSLFNSSEGNRDVLLADAPMPTAIIPSFKLPAIYLLYPFQASCLSLYMSVHAPCSLGHRTFNMSFFQVQ